MDIDVIYKNNIPIIEISGKVDINASGIIESVGKLVESQYLKIVVDLENVEAVDYNGLSVLAIAYKSALNKKGHIKFTNVPDNVMELLRIVKLDNVFDVCSDLDTAVNSFDVCNDNFFKERIEKLENPLRRRFIRLDIDLSVYYKDNNKRRGAQAQMYSGLATNVSGAGLFLRTINTLPIGTTVDLSLLIPDSDNNIPLQGIVMWLADKELQPDFFPGMGIKFVEISQGVQEGLISFIEKNTAK